MKRRILTTVVALLCTVTLLVGGLAPAYAYALPGRDGDAVVQSEEVRWYYRLHNGEKQMRLWSITQGRWRTDWIPVPDDWYFPDY